jgi:hypothetical protein
MAAVGLSGDPLDSFGPVAARLGPATDVVRVGASSSGRK